jgi:hypothetical protein
MFRLPVVIGHRRMRVIGRDEAGSVGTIAGIR